MLKIGSVKWRGKCSKHPGYDPADGGIGAIKGNCERCNQLADIYEYHQKILRLMRSFQPIEEKRKREAAAAINEFQESLFS
jgi:hypothetical protein